MNAGRVPVSDGKDFVLVEATEEDAAAAVIIKVAQRLYDARANFQVLSPRHAGAAGVTTLNQRLRAILNPGQAGLSEVRLGTETVREDDRVMVVKNDYNLDVYNGDVGKVSRVDRKAREIEVLLNNEVPARQVRFTFTDAASKLRLAYAQTVHKSQGQEYDIIVAPILGSFGLQLQRNLFYTAVTRAKKKVILVGTYGALSRAVANDRADKRNTLFSLRLSSPELFVEAGEGGSGAGTNG
jgi:exodeoxyribonuclease V alpha subunit